MSREQEVREAVDRCLARVRQDVDTQLEVLASDLLQIVQGDMRTARLDVERAAVDVARAVARGGSHARHDLISRVVVAVRRLDDALSLRGILDALGDGAAAEAARVAVLLVEPAVLRPYRSHGFPPGEGPAEVPVEAVPLLSATVKLRQATSVQASPQPGADPGLPAFMRIPAGQVGILLPLVVAGEVVAVVYADGPERDTAQAGAPVWLEQVEVLARHATARLESVTSQKTVAVLAGS